MLKKITGAKTQFYPPNLDSRQKNYYNNKKAKSVPNCSVSISLVTLVSWKQSMSASNFLDQMYRSIYLRILEYMRKV